MSNDPVKEHLSFIRGLVAVGFLMMLLGIPFVNFIVRVYLITSSNPFFNWLLAGISIFVFYFISLGLLGLLKKLLLSKRRLPVDQQILSWKGFIKTFSFYAIAILFLSDVNLPNYTTIGLAIGIPAMLIYFQYIVEYVSKLTPE